MCLGRSTLRDGAQAQGVSFTVEDKLKIVVQLDALGIGYIEAGNPGSNPKDLEFFKRVAELKLKQSDIEKIVTNIVNEHMDQENSIAKEEETTEGMGENGVVLGVAKGEDGRFYVMNAKTGEILGVK